MSARYAVPIDLARLLQGLLVSILLISSLALHAAADEQAERTYLFALKAYRDGLYEVSVEGFREYLSSPAPRAQEAEASFFLGRALLEMGRDDEALSSLEDAARADSEARIAPLARLIRSRRFVELARYGEAEAETEKWLRYFPRHELRWEAMLVRGRALVGLERLSDGASLFEEVSGSKEAPEEISLEALSMLAAVRAAQGEEAKAAGAWTSLIERAPASPLAAQARLQLAARALRAKKFREALEHSGALLKDHPRSAQAGPAMLVRAESLFGLERWKEASKAYTEAARSGGASLLGPSHWERAGLAAYRAGMFKESAEALGRAGDGPGGATLALRVQALKKAGEKAAALEGAARLLAGYPGSPGAREALRSAVELAGETGRWDVARKALAAYIEGAPSDKRMEGRYLLAHVELSAGRPEEAARLFGSVAEAEGGLDRFEDVRYKRAAALAAAGLSRQALELLGSLGPEERQAVGEKALLTLEAEILKRQEHYASAADRYRALLTRWPEAPEAASWLLDLAETEEARGRPAEALAAYRKWLEVNPGAPASAMVGLSVARLLVVEGRSDEADRMLEALAGGPDKKLAAEALLLRGRIALEAKDYAAALEASSRASEGLDKKGSAYALARWRMAQALEGLAKPSEAAAHYRWLARNAQDLKVREASEAGLKRLAAEVKETEKSR